MGGVFPGSQTEIEGGSCCGDSGGGKGQPGPRCSQPACQAQPVFGEVAESEFQEAITLVETSFLWPGLVTWLGEDQRQAGPQVWAGLHSGNCCHPLLSPEAEGGGGGWARRWAFALPPSHTHWAQTKHLLCPPCGKFSLQLGILQMGLSVPGCRVAVKADSRLEK